MGEVVNLRQARKRADRARKDAKAEANRLNFGTPKPMRESAERERQRAGAHLDGHRLSGEARPDGRDEAGTPPSDR